MNLSVERVVALFTPLFAALSAALTAWLGKHFPGVGHLNPGDVTALELAGAAAAVGAALHWLRGRQKFLSDAKTVEAFVRTEVAKATANQQVGPALSDIEALLKSHTDQIITEIGSAVHAPPSVEQVVEAIANKITGNQPAPTPAPAPVVPPTPPSV